jgi:hypothetical protein
MNRRRGFALLLCGATLVWFSPSSDWAAETRAGEVLVSSGHCFIQAAGKRAELRLGDPVSVGETVEVPAGSRLELQLNDGSVISIASGSRLTIDSFTLDTAVNGRDAEFRLLTGLLRLVVATFSGQSHFEVKTSTGVAAVRSTDWFIESREGTTQVGVLAGTVTLKSIATGTEVTVPARWGAKVIGPRDPVPPRVWQRSEFDDDIARTNAE